METEAQEYAILHDVKTEFNERVARWTIRRPGKTASCDVRHYTSFHHRAMSWLRPRRLVTMKPVTMKPEVANSPPGWNSALVIKCGQSDRLFARF